MWQTKQIKVVDPFHQVVWVVPVLIIGNPKTCHSEPIPTPSAILGLPYPSTPHRSPGRRHELFRVEQIVEGVAPHIPTDVEVRAMRQLPIVNSESRTREEGNNEDDPVLVVWVGVAGTPMPRTLIQQQRISGLPNTAALSPVLGHLEPIVQTGFDQIVGAVMRTRAYLCGTHGPSGILQRREERIRMCKRPGIPNGVAQRLDVGVPSLILGPIS